MSYEPPEELVEEWLAKLEELYPDPVDVFENNLAKALGVEPHSRLSQDEWRVLRVKLINQLTADEDFDEEGMPRKAEGGEL